MGSVDYPVYLWYIAAVMVKISNSSFNVLYPALIAALFFLSCTPSSAANLPGTVSLSLKGIKTHIPDRNNRQQKNECVYFMFPKDNSLLDRRINAGGYALELTLEVPKTAGLQKGNTAISFLRRKDFSPSGTFNPSLPAANTVTAHLASGSTVTVSFGLPGEQNTAHAICGFAVYGSIPVTVTKAAIVPLRCGWQKKSGGLWFGFDYKGGSLPADLLENTEPLAAQTVLPVPYTGSKMQRQALTVFFDEYAETGAKVSIRSKNTLIELRKPPEMSAMTVDSCFFDTSDVSDRIFVESGAADCAGIVSEEYIITDLLPITADPGLILNWPQEKWRRFDYELFRWEQFPSVLIFDFAQHKIQDDFLKRLAFYAEKKGFTGTLLPDEKIKNLHGFNAHDYSAKTLAAFFNKAEKKAFRLNDSELHLRDILFANKVIIRSGTGIIAGEGAVLSFSRETKPRLRKKLLTHECLHGIYFTQPEFRELVDEVFAQTDPRAIAFLRSYFESNPHLQYNT